MSICVIFNANHTPASVVIPEGSWNVYVRGNQAGTKRLDTIQGGSITIDPISAFVLVQEDKRTDDTGNTGNTGNTNKI